jgi:nitroimidazol reductase NimA-like FMN-containing flavoprotein (pyridoxamine 5'-phosphate oxidase superfamily)
MMSAVRMEPTAELDTNFSSPGATPTPWPVARDRLEKAEVYWLSTVRPDGRPHTVPLIALWLDGAAYFCTGKTERKVRNLAANAGCVLTTGVNTLGEGIDVVVEGIATRIADDDRLRQIAAAYVAKYGSDWQYQVRDGAFRHSSESVRSEDTSEVWVFEIAPTKIFAFGRGDSFSQTRWRF